MKKILILGSNGLIGNNITRYLKKKKLRIYPLVKSREKKFLNDINFYYYKNINSNKSLNNIVQIIERIRPHFVINCLGITKHRKTKKNLICNVNLPKILLRNRAKLNFILIHITSDCVFNGKKGNYDENYNTNAEDDYGVSKAKADQLLSNNSGVIILRTSTIGHEFKTKKGLLEWFLSQRKIVNGFKNAYFSGPTSLELGKIIYTYIIKKKLIKSGLYNIAGPKINKYKLLTIIKKIYNKKIIIKKEQKFKIDRSLNANKFYKDTKYRPKSWHKMISECKEFYKENLI